MLLARWLLCSAGLTLLIQRSVVHGRVEDVKTEYSPESVPLDRTVADALMLHKDRSSSPGIGMDCARKCTKNIKSAPIHGERQQTPRIGENQRKTSEAVYSAEADPHSAIVGDPLLIGPRTFFRSSQHGVVRESKVRCGECHAAPAAATDWNLVRSVSYRVCLHQRPFGSAGCQRHFESRTAVIRTNGPGNPR